jgi:imidazolonepropionase
MNLPAFDLLLTHATLACCDPHRGPEPLPDMAVGCVGEHIAWVGPSEQLDAAAIDAAGHVESLDGALLTPGLIDCHTHLVFGGQRAREFAMRREGASYEDIARAGGGIVSTVAATRAADEDALLAQALPRARALMADGVTTLEIKSGYGLDLESERRMLRVARRLHDQLGITVRTTYLGLHALPAEHRDDRDAYVREVCERMLPALAAEGLVDAVDAFCEGIAFSRDEVRRLFDAATALRIPVKLHAEQLSNQGGSALLASYHGLSADHLEYLDADGVAALAGSGSVAVLLPGAFYTLGETQQPPLAALREHNVPIAVATDCNPGTSPLLSLRLAANMACTLLGLTPDEALLGVTAHAAQALGLSDRGVIAPGKRADLAIWNVSTPDEFSYWIGGDLLRSSVIGGAMSGARERRPDAAAHADTR